MESDEDRAEDYRELCLSDRAMELLERTELEFIPAKIYGFERYYAVERGGRGNQLCIKETEEDNEFVNGVIATGLPDEEFQKITETEGPYEPVKIQSDRYETYLPDEKITEENIDLPDQVIAFVGKESAEDINYQTNRERHPVYHNYLVQGTEIIADLWFENDAEKEEFEQEFLSDLRSTTYEKHDGEWKTLEQKH